MDALFFTRNWHSGDLAAHRQPRRTDHSARIPLGYPIISTRRIADGKADVFSAHRGQDAVRDEQRRSREAYHPRDAES